LKRYALGEKMQYMTFKIPVSYDEEKIHDLNDFIRRHKIITIQKEFVACNQDSYWALLIEYFSGQEEHKNKQPLDYKNILPAEDFAVFSELRDLRKSISEKDGVPVYAICTNEQLAEIVKSKVTTIEQLKKIHGIGKGKIDKYGKQIVDYMKSIIGENQND